MPEELREDLTPHYVPEQFAKYNIKSSFFSNYWKSLISIAFAMAGGLFFLALEKIVKKRSGQNDTHNILMRFRMIFLWNLVLLVFCSSLSLMIIFTSLEVRDLDINTVGDGFSFAICIIANLVAIFICILNYKIVKKYRRYVKSKSTETKNDTLTTDEFDDNHQSIQVLYAGFKDNTILQQGFLLYFIMRSMVFYFIISYMHEHPLA